MHLKTILSLTGVLFIIYLIAGQYDFFMRATNNLFIQTAIVNTASSFPNGPLWKNRALYYAEYSVDRVMCRDGRGNTEFWKEDGCGPYALASFDRGLIVACRDSSTLVRLDPSGKVISKISTDVNGAPLERPFGLSSDATGGVYILTGHSKSNRKENTGKIYYLDKNGTVLKTGEEAKSPTGITVSADGRNLLISETITNTVVSYDVEAPGRLSNGRVFVHLSDVKLPQDETTLNAGPGALAVDSEGTIFISHRGASQVLLFNRSGELTQVIKTTLPYITGLTFGRLDNVIYLTQVSDIYEPPYNGAVYAFSRKRSLKATQ